MTTTAFLLALAAAVLLAVPLYLAGLRRGERLGREQTRSDLDSIARAAAERSNEQAQDAYTRTTDRVLDNLRAAARADRETGQAQFAAIATPLRDQLDQVQRLSRDLAERHARDQGKFTEVKSQLAAQVKRVEDSNLSLREALKGDRQARGRWGEIQLQNLVEQAGLTEHCDFDVQAGRNGLRPDLVLRLPGEARLPVDSKAPLDDYLRATEADSSEAQDASFAAHAKRVRQHAADLSKKNYPAGYKDSPPFTVMFLPIESLLSEAIRHDPDLLRFAAEHGVVLATPHSLMGLLWSVAAMWRNEVSTRNAEELRDAGIELGKRVGTFLGHFADVGSQLAKAQSVYNQAVGSYSTRLAPQVRKLHQLAGQPATADPGKLPRPIEVVPQQLAGEDTEVISHRQLM